MSSKSKTAATKESTTPALVPKLRFPEFLETDGWERTTLGGIARLKNGYAFKSSEYVDFGPFQIITIANVQQGVLSLEGTKRIAELPSDIQAHQKLRIGDVIISMTGNVGRICRVTCEALLLNQRVGKLIPEGIIPNFFYHLLQRDEFRNSMQLKAAGGAQGNLSGSDIIDYVLHCPSDELEQQKIAECLTSVDELIAAQARKLDALKTHKKGLMQQLFPSEGETQPRLRFPEFQNSGEWVEVALGDIAEIKLGKMLDKQKHTTGRILPYLNNISVRWNEVNTANLPQMYFKDNELDRFGLTAGDVVVCEGGEPGRAAVWDGRSPDIKFQKAIHRVRFKIPFQPRLLVLYLENLAGTTQFEMLFTGGGIRHLTRETFARFKIPLTSPAEQQRIADCLTTLDDLITAQTQKVEVLKTHKKGLMQQLFPSPKEVGA
jgi:type I restriction enzyme S subunit